MKKIVFLGCENSHSSVFLGFINQDKRFSDIEVLGVYSHEKAPMENLNEKYGAKIMSSYDEAVEEADAIVVTARHGDNHYKYAAPYIKKGIPMFIDKPITVNEDEGVKFMRECKENGVRLTGGSCCIFEPGVVELRREIEEGEKGALIGGFVCAPISMNNDFGGFYFYAQHLVAIVQAVFGMYPESVRAVKSDKSVTVLFRYDGFDVTGLFTDECYSNYSVTVAHEKGVSTRALEVAFGGPCFLREFEEFYGLLEGDAQRASYDEFISPVHILNAIMRALENGTEEKINYSKI